MASKRFSRNSCYFLPFKLSQIIPTVSRLSELRNFTEFNLKCVTCFPQCRMKLEIKQRNESHSHTKITLLTCVHTKKLTH